MADEQLQISPVGKLTPITSGDIPTAPVGKLTPLDAAAPAAEKVAPVKEADTTFGKIKNTAGRTIARAKQMANQATMEGAIQQVEDEDKSFPDLVKAVRQEYDVEAAEIAKRDGLKPSTNTNSSLPDFLYWPEAGIRYLDRAVRKVTIPGDPMQTAIEAGAGVKAAQKEQAAYPKGTSGQELEQDVAQATSITDAAKRFAKRTYNNPGGTLSWALETLGEQTPYLVAAAVSKSPAFVTGVSTYTQERYTSVDEFLRDKNIDVSNPKDIERLIKDPTILDAETRKAVIRGVIIGAGEALSMKISGVTLAKNPALEVAAHAAADTAIAGTTEAGAQLASKGKINPGDVILEAAAEPIGAIPDMAVAGNQMFRRGEATTDIPPTAEGAPETVLPPVETSDGVVSPPAPSPVTPQEAAILRRAGMAYDDILTMSAPERADLIEQAVNAGVKVNPAMVREAETFLVKNAPAKPDADPQINAPIQQPRPEVNQQNAISRPPVQQPAGVDFRTMVEMERAANRQVAGLDADPNVQAPARRTGQPIPRTQIPTQPQISQSDQVLARTGQQPSGVTYKTLLDMARAADKQAAMPVPRTDERVSPSKGITPRDLVDMRRAGEQQSAQPVPEWMTAPVVQGPNDFSLKTKDLVDLRKSAEENVRDGLNPPSTNRFEQQGPQDANLRIKDLVDLRKATEESARNDVPDPDWKTSPSRQGPSDFSLTNRDRVDLNKATSESIRADLPENAGTRSSPIPVSHPDHVEIAANRVNPEPSEAQKAIGNYQKGHIKVAGLDVTIETAKGGKRTGTDHTGKAWSVDMPAHYGYVKRTVGADGDQVDVYVGDKVDSDKVFIIDQVDPRTGRFDEHKAILGTKTKAEAAKLYRNGFSDGSGQKRLGSITTMTTAEFKDWINKSDTTKPVSSDVKTAPVKAPKKAAKKSGKSQAVDYSIVNEPLVRDRAADVDQLSAPNPADITRVDPPKIGDETAFRDIRQWLIDAGKKTGFEHFIAVDADGEILQASTSNSDRFVSLSNEFIASANNPDREIVTFHNHPIERPFSRADMLLVHQAGIHSHVVVTSEGYTHRMMLTSKARVFMRDVIYRGVKKGADGNYQRSDLVKASIAHWKRIERAITNVEKILLTEMWRLDMSGAFAADLSMDDKEILYQHARVEALAKAGIIEYKTTSPISLDVIKDATGLTDAMFNKAANAAERAYYGSRRISSLADDRRAEQRLLYPEYGSPLAPVEKHEAQIRRPVRRDQEAGRTLGVSPEGRGQVDFDPASANIDDGSFKTTSVRERDLSIIDILYNPDFKAHKPHSRNVRQVAAELQERGARVLKKMGFKDGMVSYKDITDRQRNMLARVISSEVMAALNKNEGHAGNWYTTAVKDAVDLVSLLHKEISTDPDAKTAFMLGLAITSQGETVSSNVRLADSAYTHYKKAGRFPTNIEAKNKASMNENFRKLNRLLKNGWTMEEIRAFMSEDFTVGELRSFGFDAPGENINARVKGSAILGPKIGQGFYQNLIGNFEPTTFDLWWMRAWGRITGTLVGQADEKALNKTISRFRNALQEDGMTRIPEATEGLITEAEKIVKAHERRFIKEREAFDRGDWKKSELVLAADALLKAGNGINEQPKSGGMREVMRDVASRARKIVNRSGYPEVTNADLQAIWWYPEKELYAKLGSREAKSINLDYAGAFRGLLHRKGMTDAQIEAALGQRSERDAALGGRGRDGADFPSLYGEVAVETSSFDEGAGQAGRDRRDTGRSEGSYSSGRLAPLKGVPRIPQATGPDQSLVGVAEKYAQKVGIDLKRQAEFVEVDEDRARRIAAAYDAMPHAPNDPAVKEAYADLIRQTRAQYDALTEAGYSFYFFDPEGTDPYADMEGGFGNPWNAMRDLRANKRMAVFPTEAGFGSGAQLDIGLADPKGGPDLDPQRVLDVARSFGAEIEASEIYPSDSEPTVVIRLKKPISKKVGDKISEALGQEAIVQRTDDEKGELFGPMADAWGPYNPEYFVTIDGKRASEISNPLLADTGIAWPVGSPSSRKKMAVTANDLFRAVHDAFGHGIEGAGFRARGEENAWQAHIRLFHGPAVGALTSETRGQNSWLNYGPHAENNQTAKVQDTIFADQKTGLMPSWTWEEGRAGDMQDDVFDASVEDLPAAGRSLNGVPKEDTAISPLRRGEYPYRLFTPRNHSFSDAAITAKNRAHKQAVEMTLPIEDIVTDNEVVGRSKVKNPSSGLPFVEKIGGVYHLIDGNHRVTAAKLRGEKNVRVMVADMSEAIAAAGREIPADAEFSENDNTPVISLAAKRDEKQLKAFHSSLMDDIRSRAIEAADGVRRLRDEGLLPLQIGDRFMTQHTREKGQPPYVVEGYYYRAKDGSYGYHVKQGDPDNTRGEEWTRTMLPVYDQKAEDRLGPEKWAQYQKDISTKLGGLRLASSNPPSDAEFSESASSFTDRVGSTSIEYVVQPKDRFGGKIEIIELKTEASGRGKGDARRAMQALLQRADDEGRPVELLSYGQDDTTDDARLTEFYKSLGFKALYNDPDGGVFMRRDPQISDVKRQEAKDRFMSGNSPIVPDVLYHGNRGDFSTFDRSKIGNGQLGFHAGTIDHANHFAVADGGNVMPVHISLKNPIRMQDSGSWIAWDVVTKLRDMGIISADRDQSLSELLDQTKVDEDRNEIIIDILRNLGHDGIVYLNRFEGQYKDGTTVQRATSRHMSDEAFKVAFPGAQDSFIVFKPTQIKSATGNNGDFDPKNPDINYRAPDGWGEVEGGAQSWNDLDQAEAKQIIERTTGMTNVEFWKEIVIPNGSAAWGSEGQRGTAAGFFSAQKAIIVLALDSANKHTVYHEAFHAIQSWYLTPREQQILAHEMPRLRSIVGEMEGNRSRIALMSDREVQAEAAALWANKRDGRGIHIALRRAWDAINEMIRRARNILHGKGFQTSEDIFRAFHAGDMKKRAQGKAVAAGKDHSKNPDVVWSKSRIDRVLNEYGYTMDGRSKGWVGWVDPRDFLRVTTGDDNHMSAIISEAGSLDAGRLKNEGQTPFLIIRDAVSGAPVFSHEGRHRMAALAKAGFKSVPIVLRDYERNTKAPKSSTTLKAQFAGRGKITISNLIPLNNIYRSDIEDAMTGGDLEFSTRQDITETDAFKRWFGKSLVRDEPTSSRDKGPFKPKRVYHGTRSQFDAFRAKGTGTTSIMGMSIEHDRHGIFFAEDPAFAETFANPPGSRKGGTVGSYYLKIENPLWIDNDGWVDPDDIKKLVDAGVDARWAQDYLGGKDTWEAFDGETGEEFVEALKTAGFDGVRMLEVDPDIETGDGTRVVWVALDPKQVKSVNNNGAFSPDDDRFDFAVNPPQTRKARKLSGNIAPIQAVTATTGGKVNAFLTDMSQKAVAKSKETIGRKYDRMNPEDGELLGAYLDRKAGDYLRPLKDMMEDPGVNLNDTMDAYQTARLAEGTTRYKVEQVRTKYVMPMVRALADVGATLEEFHTYAYSMHAEERNNVVGQRWAHEPTSAQYRAIADHDIVGASGMSTNEAKRNIARARQDPVKFAGLERARKHLRSMLDSSLDEQLRAGLINQDQYDRLTKQWKDYVPLRAEADQDPLDAGGFPSKSRGFDIRGKDIQAATGRFTPADNVFVYALTQAEHSLVRAEKNRVGQAMLRFINRFDPQGMKYAEVYWSEDPATLGSIDKAMPVYKRTINAKGEVVSQKVNDFTMRDDVVATKVGGKVYYIRFADPKVGLAMKKMTFAEIGAATLLGKISHLVSFTATRANPAFFIPNAFRDAIGSSIIMQGRGFSMKDGIKMLSTIPQVYPALWRSARGKAPKGQWDAVVDEFRSHGGEISFDPFNTVEQNMRMLQKEMSRQHPGVNPLKHWPKIWKFIQDVNGTIENATRVAAYHTARQVGDTPAKAAFKARDLIDYQKKGEVGPMMNSAFAFWNAAVQGSKTFVSVANSQKVKTALLALMAMGALQHIWNMMWAEAGDDGEDDYTKMLRTEAWKFERQMVFRIPGSKGYLTIPLPYIFNGFWHAGMQASAATTGHTSPMAAFLDTVRVGATSFNPFGSNNIETMIMPTALDPLVEIYTNKDWLGNKISNVPSEYDPAPDPAYTNPRGDVNPAFTKVSEWMNYISGGDYAQPGLLDVSPNSMEYLFGFVTGGLGRFINQTVQTGVNATKGEFIPDRTPLLRSLFTKPSEHSSANDFYDMRREVQRVGGIMKTYKENGDKDKIEELRKSNPVEFSVINDFKAASSQLRKINAQKNKLEASDYPDKEARIEALEKTQAQIMDRARRAYIAAKKGMTNADAR